MIPAMHRLTPNVDAINLHCPDGFGKYLKILECDCSQTKGGAYCLDIGTSRSWEIVGERNHGEFLQIEWLKC